MNTEKKQDELNVGALGEVSGGFAIGGLFNHPLRPWEFAAFTKLVQVARPPQYLSLEVMRPWFK